jgi:catechol 2,3-dioxygenase-like lactoylglutathione lyase family enzyme
MEPVIDHIQLTLKDLDNAEKFYDRFLPVLGFDIQRKVKPYIPEHDFHVIEYSHNKLSFAITSPREAFKNDEVHRRKPGSLHHLAFKAESRDEVDQAYNKLVGIGAVIVTPPKLYPEYSENYYAVFFKDVDNIKYEIVCNK